MPLNCEQINPYGDNDNRHKGEQVREMFDNIAPAYDFMNRAMTFGIDKSWRRKAVGIVAASRPRDILDVATGTGDLAIALADASPQANVVGIDLSEGMLQEGRRKVKARGLDNRIRLCAADCLSLPMADGSFDAVTVAYGVRNFENLRRGYAEMLRVLRPGGILCVLELSTPVNPLVKPFYGFYTGFIIPMAGRLIAGDRRAYSYLPESIAAVAQGSDMTALMESAGFSDASFRRLTFGVCTLYIAYKR
ncbi:MAG: bifunctional demethylmenaquinone methyltransferase/2-methoxy-6-polyprenyl-1,4-benzoquinol methylase UbiE [Paramuribaculum sp.]|nr:bifunctional demethylmenaquinone methyltransferase/2-methoxy-6-polyprenyl-1,4-benzoquinol methylase UbiE [Paramuribaculum sp.]